MHKMRCVSVTAAVLALAGLVGADASAEIEGALQYPPPSGCPTATAG
jgi:hypothetical protein